MGVEGDFVLNIVCVSVYFWLFLFEFCNVYFSGTYTIIQKYRDKCGVLEYFIAGITSGVLYKFTLGPRGWIVGAGVGRLEIKAFKLFVIVVFATGGVLGLVGGGLTNLLLNLSGMTMDEARLWQNHWQEKRIRYNAKKMEEHREKEENILLYKYSQAHADEKVSLDNLENKT